VYGRILTWAEALAALRTVNFEYALMAMAMLNAVSFEFSQIGDLKKRDGPKKISALILYLLPEEVRGAAWEEFVKADLFQPLAPQACVAMTEACMRHCDRKGGAIMDQPWNNPVFAHVLLSFQSNLLNEALVHPGIDFDNLADPQFRAFTRNYLSTNYNTDFMAGFIRHHMMYEIPIEGGALRGVTGIGSTEWFASVARIDPVTYRLIQVALVGAGFTFSLEDPQLKYLVLNLDQFLASLKPEFEDVFRRLFAQAVVNLAEVDAVPAPVDWDGALYAANYLRRRPIIRLGGENYLLLHRHLILEKYFMGSSHVLTEIVTNECPAGWPAQPRKRGSKVRTELGLVFEDYVRMVLGCLFKGPDAVFKHGYQVGGDAAERDTLVVIGTTAVVFELVHHPWSLADRAGGASNVFVTHVADNARKSGEVADAIEAGNPVAGVRFVVDRILPIVVMSDTMPINETTSASLGRALVAEVGNRAVDGHGTILPLQTLSLTQLENLDRIFPESGGKQPILDFLAVRARDAIERFCGQPDMGKRAGQFDRLKLFQDASERLFKEKGPLIFLPGHDGGAPTGE
jgi:hypothetical protein